MILERIIEAKREEVATAKSRCPLAQLKKRETPPVRDFIAAVRRAGGPPRKRFNGEREDTGASGRAGAEIGEAAGIRLIAEIKKASPSRGLICRDFNPPLIAGLYQEAGAGAISVLTDQRFFEGRPEFLKAVKEVTSIPLLRKDFIIDEYQIYQSRVLGADAVLLIAAILSRRQLADYISLVKGLGMAALVEVHTLEELCRVLETEALLLGINNRDLHTFQVDLGVTFRLISAAPKGRVVVSESGIRTAQDVACLARAGVDAVLVGEALTGARDIRAAAAELLGAGRT
jgi:indole-3-glycerol phosphate synthase